MQSQTIISIDARGLRCPLPVLRLARAMRDAPLASRFSLVADDPAAAADVPAFADEMGLSCRATGELEWLLSRD